MAKKSSVHQKQMVRAEELGRLIREKRWKERLTLKDVEAEIGVSASTLSRLERWDLDDSSKSTSIPDANTLTTLSRWLDIPIEGVVLETDRTLPEVVEIHLRADRNLSPETAEKLSEIFRLAYEQAISESDEVSTSGSIKINE